MDKIKILLADDDEDVLGIYKFRLENDGFSVDTATDGTSAIIEATRIDPDVLVLDYRMPPGEEGGLSALTQLRRQGFFKPIIMVTGSDDQRVAIQSFREGVKDNSFFDFLHKPVDLDVLVLKVKLAYLHANAANRGVRIVDEMITLYTALSDLRKNSQINPGADSGLESRVDGILRRFATVTGDSGKDA